MESKKVLGASLGTCVHVAGVYGFLTLAERFGYQTVFLGPARSPREVVEAVFQERPSMVIVGYRLTECVAERLFKELQNLVTRHGLFRIPWVLSCTPQIEPVARKSGLFTYIFTGREPFSEIVASLVGPGEERKEDTYPGTLPERIAARYPFPLLRHHFGLPTVEETVEGVRRISEAKVVDVISLGPDQNAQEFFFEPHRMDETHKGAGGVPLRRREDLVAIFEASRRGNFPLLRCYSGTNHLKEWAHLLHETIRIAWGAVPIFWYSELDGRSKRPLPEAIRENLEAMKTYIDLGVPIEVNDAHQWSLRGAPDSVAVASFFLGAYIAKKLGARYYVAQYMLNTPPGIVPRADLAKMLAKKDLVQTLEDATFTVFTQIRGGLAHFSPHLEIAKGQLAASTFLGLFLRPHIVHVVNFSEGDHLARPEEVIESAHIVQGVLKDALFDLPDAAKDPYIAEHRARIKQEALLLLEALKSLGQEEDPFLDLGVLAGAVTRGLFDAPHLLGNPWAKGKIQTRIVEGMLYPVDEKGRVLSEEERLRRLGFSF
ncbi:methionine synthase [Candidatus Caldatribacterium sp. SIUC1]|uniref:methionine synthase n=1 Tax=Candidatus Caldatribacterium sp. SIUC1 TaxID=3418365 RepID=UPI003F690F27